MGTVGRAAAPLHAGDSRGCLRAVPVSSALPPCTSTPLCPGAGGRARRGPFEFCCLYLGGNQLPSILASPRCELAGLAALHASPWMSLSVPPALGLLGACAAPSNPPLLANHLLAKLVINSFPGSLGKSGPASTCCSRVPLPARCPMGRCHHGTGHHHRGTEGPSPG